MSAQDEVPNPGFGGGTGMVGYDGGANERAHAVAVDSSGNVYVAGTQNDNDFLLLKYGPTGTLLWTRLLLLGDGELNAVVVDNATGDVTVAGSYGGGWEMYVLRYTGNGDLYGDDDPLNPVGLTPFGNQNWIGAAVNDRFVFSNNSSYVTGLVMDASGELYLTGWEDDGISIYGLTMKLDTHGHRYGDSSSPDVATTSFGNSEYGDGNGTSDAADFNLSGSDRFYSIARDSATGHLYVAGESSGVPLVAKYDSSGLLVEPFGNGDYDGNTTSDHLVLPFNNGQFYALAVDGAGNILAAGAYVAGSDNDYFVVKLTPAGVLIEPFGNFDLDGNTINDAIVLDSGFGDDRIYGMAIDNAAGFFVVTGTFGVGGGTEIRTMKFATATGVQLHSLSYKPAGFSSEARAIALGSFFVAGFESNGAGEDIRLIKYSSPPPAPDNGDNDGVGCGMIGLEALMLLGLIRIFRGRAR
ncbi:MAG: hypothetical protein HYY17_16325 [Planctomycetes bacterium]|nr:hypothetical protein [Planctomycetota bacterium]